MNSRLQDELRQTKPFTNLEQEASLSIERTAARITGEGLALLDRIDAPLAALHARQLGHLTSEQLQALIDLLALAREGS